MSRAMVGAAVSFAAALVLTAAAADAQGGNPFLGTLWAGKYTDAGTYSLGVTPDCSELVVQLIPQNGWEIVEYQVEVVSDPVNFPLNRAGNPKIGQFRWRASFPPSGTTQTLHVPSGQVIDPVACPATTEVAIHADMVLRDALGAIIGEEGAWGGPYAWGDQAWNPHGFLPDGFFDFPGAQWGFYLSFLWEGASTPTPTATPTPTPELPTPTPVLPTPTLTPVGPTPTVTPISLTPTPVGPTPTVTPISLTPTPVGPTPTPVQPRLPGRRY